MDDPVLRMAWRRRVLVLAVALATAAGAAAVVLTLDKVYEATSRLIIVPRERVGDLGGIQAAQITARTYSEIMRSPNVERRVEARLAATGTPRREGSSVTIRPVPETQLIAITAEGSDALSAKRLADAYASVVLEYAETRLEATTGARLSLADAAPLRREPVRPDVKLYILLAALMGLPLGIAAAVLRERMDARVRGAHEVEDLFDVPVVGRIPPRGKTPDEEAAFRESFRLLRVSLGHALPVAQGASVAITSASSGEGKSTVTYALAVASSEAGKRVIVVDGDVRRGSQAHMLRASVQPGDAGLVDALLGRATLDEVLYATPMEAVLVLPPGRSHDALSSALGTVQAPALMAALAERADLVIIDCPPLGAGADASVLAASATSTLLVTRLRRTSRPDVAQALHQLQVVGAGVIGCVVNADPLRTEPYPYTRTRLPGA